MKLVLQLLIIATLGSTAVLLLDMFYSNQQTHTTVGTKMGCTPSRHEVLEKNEPDPIAE